MTTISAEFQKLKDKPEVLFITVRTAMYPYVLKYIKGSFYQKNLIDRRQRDFGKWTLIPKEGDSDYPLANFSEWADGEHRAWSIPVEFTASETELLLEYGADL